MDECVEVAHVSRGVHRFCVVCGGVTCMRSMVIDPVTLRRHLVPKCSSDTLWELLDPQTVAEHEKLARRRTELDWALTLPDQFPSLSRTVVR